MSQESLTFSPQVVITVADVNHFIKKHMLTRQTSNHKDNYIHSCTSNLKNYEIFCLVLVILEELLKPLGFSYDTTCGNS